MATEYQATGRWRRALEVTTGLTLLAAAVVMLVLGVTILGVVKTGPGPGGHRPETGPVAESLPTAPIDTGDAAILGDREAPVVLVEFSDFQCPVCVRFSESMLPTLKSRYIDTGKVALAFHHLPLEAIHPFAFAAAQASECGAAQGRFWPMHDALFGLKGRLERTGLNQAAQAAGLAAAGFESCMNGGATKDKVARDIATAKTLNLRGTPSFFMGVGKPKSKVRITARFPGIPKPEALLKAIDDALAEAKASPSTK